MVRRRAVPQVKRPADKARVLRPLLDEQALLFYHVVFVRIRVFPCLTLNVHARPDVTEAMLADEQPRSARGKHDEVVRRALRAGGRESGVNAYHPLALPVRA